MGASIAVALLPARSRNQGLLILAAATVACLPDLDLLPVVLSDLPRQNHRGFTHSICFALLATTLLATILGTRRRRVSLILGLALLSHGLLDALTTSRSNGVALLWPFTDERWRLGLFQLRGLSLAGNLSEVLANTAVVFVTEAALFVPILLLAAYFQRSRRGPGTPVSANI